MYNGMNPNKWYVRFLILTAKSWESLRRNAAGCLSWF